MKREIFHAGELLETTHAESCRRFSFFSETWSLQLICFQLTTDSNQISEQYSEYFRSSLTERSDEFQSCVAIAMKR